MRITALLCTIALLFAACGDDDDTTSDTSTSTTESTTTTTTEVEPTSSTSTTLPGEQVEIFPYEDAELSVVGVAVDDVLHVRSGPGVDYEVLVDLDPLDTGMIATGHNRYVGDAFWAELDADGTIGWVNMSFVLQAGVVDDVTTALYPTPADRPSAETLLELAQTVAGEVASEDPASEITVVDGPSVGDLGEVVVDVIGLGDDSVGGVRLHVFAEEDASGESFTLRTVEQTTMCSRGVTDDGLCI